MFIWYVCWCISCATAISPSIASYMYINVANRLSANQRVSGKMRGDAKNGDGYTTLYFTCIKKLLKHLWRSFVVASLHSNLSDFFLWLWTNAAGLRLAGDGPYRIYSVAEHLASAANAFYISQLMSFYFEFASIIYQRSPRGAKWIHITFCWCIGKSILNSAIAVLHSDKCLVLEKDNSSIHIGLT